MRLVALHPTRNVQRGLDRTQLPIVVSALRQQVLAQLVQNNKLPRQQLRNHETLRHQHDLANNDQIRDAHTHRPEQRLQRLRQLRTSWVSRVHRNESHNTRPQRNLHIRKQKPLLPRPNRIQHRLILGRTHRQHRHWDTIKLIKASPRTSLGKTLVRLSHHLEIHLIRTIKDVHLDTQRTRQVLHRLRLSGPRGTRRGTSQTQPLGLGQRDVATIRQRGNNQTSAVTDVLILVLDLRVADVNLRLLGLLVLDISELRLPLEGGSGVNAFVHQARDHITGVDINRTESHNLLPVSVGELSINQLDQVVQMLHLLPVEVLQRVIITLLELIKRLVHLHSVERPRDNNRNLRRLLKQPLRTRLLIVRDHTLLPRVSQRVSHTVHHILQPGLDSSVARTLLCHLYVLLLTREHTNRLLRRLSLLVQPKLQIVQVVKALRQVPKDQLRVRTLRKDVQQVRRGNEVKPRESDPLRFQVLLKRLLTHLELTQHIL
mmetsp:Transcript_12554/g.15114  ORF Transcript_12554/g.15114 Transcript_12554/m.15114 type:complete len:488 (-) Transcript_12554:4788-6251(-)